MNLNSLICVLYFIIISIVVAQRDCTDNRKYESVDDLLDTYCDSTQWGWHVDNATIPSWDDWFFYFDNLSNLSSSAHAQEFFEAFDLINFSAVEGVWVAYYTEIPPNPSKPYPIIVTRQGMQIREMEIIYYLHNNATIVIDGSIELKVEPGQVNWMRYEMDGTRSKTIELVTHQPGDFIFIDKILLQWNPLTTTTTTTVRHTSSSTQTLISDPSTAETVLLTDTTKSEEETVPSHTVTKEDSSTLTYPTSDDSSTDWTTFPILSSTVSDPEFTSTNPTSTAQTVNGSGVSPHCDNRKTAFLIIASLILFGLNFIKNET